MSNKQKYRLKVDVLWYKAGTEFYYEDGSLYFDGDKTLDDLQLAIASHAEDEDIQDYIEPIIDDIAYLKTQIIEICSDLHDEGFSSGEHYEKGRFSWGQITNWKAKEIEEAANDILALVSDFYKNYDRYVPTEERIEEGKETLGSKRLSEECVFFDPSDILREETGMTASVFKIEPGEYAVSRDCLYWSVVINGEKKVFDIPKHQIRSDLGYNPYLKQGE